MMVVMPPVIQVMGLDPLVGGAWLGGTIDATGAVVAAGETLGTQAGEVAATVKMIQNSMIGRPVVLYVAGQSLNLALTLAMASLTFGWLFRKMVEP